jgi:guanylate kinase
VVSGPSGAGKGTVIRGVLARMPELRLAVSATTRPPRGGEVDGRDYRFLSPAEFERRVAAGDFLEHVSYAGNRYGTLLEEIRRPLAEGRPVIVEIELRGARAVRAAIPEALLVFIAPPSEDELRERLERRGTDTAQEIAARMSVSREELAATDEFDHVIVNADVRQAVDELVALLRAEAHG